MNRYMLMPSVLVTLLLSLVSGASSFARTAGYTDLVMESDSPTVRRVVLSETEDFIDLRTGNVIRLHWNAVTNTYVREDQQPLDIFVGSVSQDTFWGPEAILVNNALAPDAGGYFTVDWARMERNGEGYKVKSEDGEMKIKENENELKMKDGDAKIKANENEIKRKVGDEKLKENENGLKMKDGDAKVKLNENELKMKDGDAKVKENENELKSKSGDAKLKSNDEEYKYKEGDVKVKSNNKETKIKTDDTKTKINHRTGEVRTKEK